MPALAGASGADLKGGPHRHVSARARISAPAMMRCNVRFLLVTRVPPLGRIAAIDTMHGGAFLIAGSFFRRCFSGPLSESEGDYRTGSDWWWMPVTDVARCTF